MRVLRGSAAHDCTVSEEEPSHCRLSKQAAVISWCFSQIDKNIDGGPFAWDGGRNGWIIYHDYD